MNFHFKCFPMKVTYSGLCCTCARNLQRSSLVWLTDLHVEFKTPLNRRSQLLCKLISNIVARKIGRNKSTLDTFRINNQWFNRYSEGWHSDWTLNKQTFSISDSVAFRKLDNMYSDWTLPSAHIQMICGTRLVLRWFLALHAASCIVYLFIDEAKVTIT